MTQILNPTDAVPASTTDVDEAPWCQAHWADLGTPSGAAGPDGQVGGAGLGEPAGAALAAPIARHTEIAL